MMINQHTDKTGILISLKTGDIHFDLTSALKSQATIWVKNYFVSVSAAKVENYTYITLKQAADNLDKKLPKSNIFAVVQSTLKVAFDLLFLTYFNLMICFFHFSVATYTNRQRILSWDG